MGIIKSKEIRKKLQYDALRVLRKLTKKVMLKNEEFKCAMEFVKLLDGSFKFFGSTDYRLVEFSLDSRKIMNLFTCKIEILSICSLCNRSNPTY